jgi:hypothetical protein
MRARQLGLLIFSLIAVNLSVAHAEQRRDWVLDVTPAGNRFYFDYAGTGLQGTLEHRGKIYGQSNSYAFNVSSLVGWPAGQLQASASLRILFFELSGTVGYRTVWRNLSFEPGDNGEYCKDCDSRSRRARDPILGDVPENNGPDTDHFPYAEATISLYAPLNEWMVFASFFSAHYENGRPRSYDQFFTNVHDPGLMWISETTFFLKHRDWGGIGPYVQILSLPRAGQHEVEVAWGLNAMTRLGLIRRNDALFATVLLRPDDKSYGQHSYYLPMRALLVYRMAFDL